MPYKTNKEIKEKVNGADKLTDKQLDQFRAVFNKTFEDGKSEEDCYAIAWGAVNKSRKSSVSDRTNAITARIVKSIGWHD